MIIVAGLLGLLALALFVFGAYVGGDLADQRTSWLLYGFAALSLATAVVVSVVVWTGNVILQRIERLQSSSRSPVD